jgi:hypothetical protein
MTDPLDALHAASEGLLAVRSRLDVALIEAKVRPLIRMQAADTATDILDAALVLEEAHAGATEAQEKETRRLFTALPSRVPPAESRSWSLAELSAWSAKQPQPTAQQWAEVATIMEGQVTRAPYAKAKVAYKALLFFVRAYQDALYRAFLETRGERAGLGSTMSKGLVAGKPLAGVLAEDLDQYGEWFQRWRDKRNRVKEGVSIAFTGVGGFGLIFQSVTDEGGLVGEVTKALTVSDVVEAVSMSITAATRIAEYAGAESSKSSAS